MYIFYNSEDGQISYTVSTAIDIERVIAESGLACLEVEGQPSTLGCKIIGGELVRVSIHPDQEAALAVVKDRISSARGMFVTALPAQDMIYLRKEQEARDYMASDPDPDLEDFPMIAAEIGITGDTAYEVAQVWLNMSYLWTVMASQLEAIRLSANTAIQDAVTKEDVEDALTTFHAALDDLIN